MLGVGQLWIGQKRDQELKLFLFWRSLLRTCECDNELEGSSNVNKREKSDRNIFNLTLQRSRLKIEQASCARIQFKLNKLKILNIFFFLY